MGRISSIMINIATQNRRNEKRLQEQRFKEQRQRQQQKKKEKYIPYRNEKYLGDRDENGNAHGKGTFIDMHGNIYEGSWKNHQRHGKGTMEYANGDIFEGQWEDGVRSGIGVLLYANGDRYEGSFRDDAKEGPGRHYYIKSKKIYDGEWHNDMAKCGVYSDMPKEFTLSPQRAMRHYTPYAFLRSN